jgi:hypothetical protein
VSVACTAIEPVWKAGIAAVRRTVRLVRVAVAATWVTGPTTRIIAGAVGGSWAEALLNVLPGDTTSRLPRAPMRLRSWTSDEVLTPWTATIAVMPMQMPSADSTARSRRARSPTLPTRRTSRAVSRLRSARSARRRARRLSPWFVR